MVGRKPRWTLARAVTLVAVSFVLFKFVFIPIRIEGTSMMPAYRDGRINLINRLAYRWRGPARRDVVAVRQDRHRLVLLKRVVGLPGERIKVRSGYVFINGERLEEPYAKGSSVPSSGDEVLLGPNEYFVIGDNRDVSVYGVVFLREIIGKAVF